MMGACVRHNKTIKLWNNNSRVSLVVHMQLVLKLRRASDRTLGFYETKYRRSNGRSTAQTYTKHEILKSFIGMDEGTSYRLGGGLSRALQVDEVTHSPVDCCSQKKLFSPISRHSSFESLARPFFGFQRCSRAIK